MLTNKRRDGSTEGSTRCPRVPKKKAHDKQAHEYPWSLWSCKTGLKLQNEDMYILHSRPTVFYNIFCHQRAGWIIRRNSVFVKLGLNSLHLNFVKF